MISKINWIKDNQNSIIFGKSTKDALYKRINKITMELTGTIKKIEEAKTFGSGFRKRELVLTTDEQYPQFLLVEFTQDKCDLLNNYKEGEQVKIGINLRGREWVSPAGETKYFNSIQGWRIEKMNNQVVPSGIAPDQEFETTTDFNLSEDEDDLPF